MQIMLDIDDDLLAMVQLIARRQASTVGKTLGELARKGMSDEDKNSLAMNDGNIARQGFDAGAVDFELMPFEPAVNLT